MYPRTGPSTRSRPAGSRSDHRWNSRWRSSGALVLISALALVSQAVGATPAPPTDHAERMTFDPKSRQWIVTPPPSPGTEDGDLDIARQWLARGEYKTVVKIVSDWVKSYPESPRYAEAVYLRATANLERGDYYEAHKGYQELLNSYPGSPYAEQALAGEFRIAEQYLAGKRRKAWGGLIWIRDRDGGIEILNDMITHYSDTSYAPLGQLTKADYYFDRGDLELAEDEYAIYARDYPRSRYHSKALFRAAWAALASFRGIKFDESALIEAKERFNQFMDQYPEMARQQNVPVFLEQIESTRADKCLDIAKFYEKTDKIGAARYYYRKTARVWPGTPAAAEAAQRLAKLGEPVEVADATH